MLKITFSHNFLWVNFRRNFTFLLGLCLSIFIFNFNAAAVFALYTPTLSASMNQTNLQINGNQVINSTNKTIEIPLNLTINTNNKTGYTATLSSETENTALINTTSTSGAKINSIGTNLSLNNLPNNTWGYKFGVSSNYAPIPALSSPTQILQTAGKTNGNESNQLSIGMKLSDNLESGRYTNKLIFSILTNNYDHIAIMTEGPDFNTKLKSLVTATSGIMYFKKSTVVPTASMNAVNIEDEESDDEIKLWLDPTDKTAYYYTESEKVYLNRDARSMFYWMSNLTSLDLSNFDTSKVIDMKSMFYCMRILTTINLSNFNTSKVTNMSSMFYDMYSLTALDLSSFDTSQVTDMSDMFYNMRILTTINLSNFNTSRVTNMGHMFSYMTGITTLDLSNFDTSKVTDMGGMFSFMYNLTTFNLSNFDTSQVTNMYGMFSSTSNLTTLNLSGFNTSNVTNMGYMFAYMPNLTTLNLSNFNTSNVTDMGGMFSSTSNLTTLNLSGFNTSNVTNMGNMFSHMTGLTTLDLSNFDTSKVTDMGYMFYLWDNEKPKDKLEKIYVNNDFDTTKLTNISKMFKNRMKLRGGNGSYLPDPSTADKTWLRVDRPGVQGYFTRKS